MVILENKFPTEKNCKEQIIDTIKNSLYRIHSVPAIDEKDLNLILDEALDNAMEHGNRWDPKKKIMIQVCLAKNCIEVIIKDEGEGFDYNNRAVPRQSADPEIRGRGISLIKKLSNSEWLNNGSTIKINIPVTKISCR